MVESDGKRGGGEGSDAWAELSRTPEGVPEVSARWVSVNAAHVRLVDIREPDEYTGPLGHIAGSELIPMRVLGAAASEWAADEPLVLVCRSGARSAWAALQLEEHGFTRVASMAGGMLDWREAGLPVA